jgi:hypothetical protein
VIKAITHSKRACDIACRLGWLPGARYTNLRDVRSVERLGFLDIDWKNYNFRQHLAAARATSPLLTVARDIERRTQLAQVLDQAEQLAEVCEHVIIVPKSRSMSDELEFLIPKQFLLGYSVPTKYGGTRIRPRFFKRPVHLLGGRPDTQRDLATRMKVVSLDCNRFTLDARYGDYFDGERFRPHPVGGYDRCLRDSVVRINQLWENYRAPCIVQATKLLREAV